MSVRCSARRILSLTAAACLAAALPLTSATAEQDAPPTYRNPVTAGYSIDFPDPTVMLGKDGYWYGYSTGGPYTEAGNDGAAMKVARSTDLTHWQKVGAVFDSTNRPDWATASSGLWAPDVRTINGKYLLYFAVPDSKDGGSEIGVATAPSPAGPWTDSGAPLLRHQQRPNGSWQSLIDPAEFTDVDGHQYLYYGSFNGGIWMVPLTDDGLHQAGPQRQVASSKFEGGYVIRHGGRYYLMASDGGCCNGPTSGYTVVVGRSDSPFGPFVDAAGVSLLASRTGGTIVIASNGNRWVGTGHNAVVTDLSGKTWMAYHAIDKNDPYLHTNPGYTMRPMLLDPIDWVNGWPTVRAGYGASDQPERAPVTRGPVYDRFESPSTDLRTVAGGLDVRTGDPESGGFARLSDATAVATATVPADVRVEADVRADSGSVGLLARYRDARTGVSVVLDAARRELRATATADGSSQVATAALPADVDVSAWHNLAVQVRGGSLTADLTDARLGDPYATLHLTVPAALRGNGAVGITGTGDVDNLSAAGLYQPFHGHLAPLPHVGPIEPAYSDDFTHGLSPAWSWVRQDADAHVQDGQFVWPTQAQDLTTSNSSQAGILLRAAPAGRYVVETKLDFDIGVDTVRNWQQAGLIIYLGDTHFLRLDVVAKDETRITEFGKKMPIDGLYSWGAGDIGPPAATTWLRIAHRIDPTTGENLYRAGSSTDGTHWSWGLVWTLPAGTHAKIGLVSQGALPQTNAQYGPATARFDYVRVYR